MKYTVYVDDNFHNRDAEERYILGVYETEEEAVNAAKMIVDEFLLTNNGPKSTANDLYELYCGFGEDPWITYLNFNAWDYAKLRCTELCHTD